MKGFYLITADNWFNAPDGRAYRAVWGNVEILQDSFLGVTTNRNSANWFAKVGTAENHVLIAGCQIHYAVKCYARPFTGSTPDYTTEGGALKEFERPTQIYIAE
jgi:hypothetical protein